MTHLLNRTSDDLICSSAGSLVQKLAQQVKSALLIGLVASASAASAVNLTPLPPYLTEVKGAPMIMLNMSRDHQLFNKAYNEYSDLDGDGVIETQYKHSYKYYGYFDNQRCYTYNTSFNRFIPTRKTDTAGYCNYAGGANEWAGNFMNWGTMTRMDVVRRILYGGMRSTDDALNGGAALTVLERANLGHDAHSFAKYYIATDISKLTPFDRPELTLCNASASATAPPDIFVADGNYALWSAGERWQCHWYEEQIAPNGNNPAITNFGAAPFNPSRNAQGLGTGYAKGSYTGRVEVCKTGLSGGFTADEVDRCKLYPAGSYKPIGLLQKNGEGNQAAFGLMTGSFDRNTSGGVLRKNLGSFTDEVDITNGQFKTFNGIVSTLNKLRLYGYNYGDGTYTADGASCNYQSIGLVDGECASWGNPMGEIYLESLRYLAGGSPNGQFQASSRPKDNSMGLTVQAWTDPFAPSTTALFGERLCRRNSVINFNASVTSYDNDQWSGISTIAGMSTSPLSANSVENYTNQIGIAEGLSSAGTLWAVGRNGVDNNSFCSDKAVTAGGTSGLANINGVCPAAPTQYGGYKAAGAALYAHLNPIRNDIPIPAANKRAFKVNTYSVALATGTPRIKIPVPGQPGKFVFISPAFRLDVGSGGGGTLVDFRVLSQTPTSGKYIINWEDSEQGGDFDQDVFGILEYSVVGNTLFVKTYVVFDSTGNPQGFGYSISGTNAKDGIHFHSGIHGFNYNDAKNIAVSPTGNTNSSGGCNNCQTGQAATTAAYTMVGQSAESLQDPLWYAAKYGGFKTNLSSTPYTPGSVLPVAAWDSKNADGSIGADGIPDNFFFAVDPSQLEVSLQSILDDILGAGGAAPVASSSNTSSGGFTYKSTFSIAQSNAGSDAIASGTFKRLRIAASGTASNTADWDAGVNLSNQNWNTGRRILTLSSAGAVPFRWNSIDAAQKLALQTNPKTGVNSGPTAGQNRLEWLRGNSANETAAGGLRARPITKLGAIVNSSPAYVGAPSAGYTNAAYGGGYNTFRLNNTATNAVFVAANDGMLHAIDGASGDELFAYVPRAMYATTTVAPFSKLSAVTDKDFALGVGTGGMTVDGSLMSADMKVGGNWSTYLFGAFGRGAKGVYALDVTKPQNVTEASTSLVKWEFSEATGDPDMGFITGRSTTRGNGQPFQTGYMANGKWAAIYGNGYNSASGKAAIFILFADGPGSASATAWTPGTHYVKIAVGAGGIDNGMATPTAVDSNNDGVIDFIYAGDLQGQVWKFDVRSADTTQWKVATTGGVPLYKAVTAVPGTNTLVIQPITTTVQPYPNPKGGFQLVFGTGKSLANTDYPSTVAYPNTIYSLYDKPGSTGAITTGLTDLVAQTVTQTLTAAGLTAYLATTNVDYATKKGFYIPLPGPSESSVFSQEAFDPTVASIKTLFVSGEADGCSVPSNGRELSFNPISGLPLDNLVPGAPLITGYAAAGLITANSYEVGSGGIYRVPPPPPPCVPGTPGCTECVPGTPGCTKCVPGTPGCKDECVPGTPACSQCVYRTFSANSSGAIETTLRQGKCTEGRLTWREVLRNR